MSVVFENNGLEDRVRGWGRFRYTLLKCCVIFDKLFIFFRFRFFYLLCGGNLE